MTEYGVWDSEAGGFVSTQAYSVEEAQADRQRIAAGIDDPDDRADFLTGSAVKAICAVHEEQPADACEDCDADPA